MHKRTPDEWNGEITARYSRLYLALYISLLRGLSCGFIKPVSLSTLFTLKKDFGYFLMYSNCLNRILDEANFLHFATFLPCKMSLSNKYYFWETFEILREIMAEICI